ncbi:CpsD/CapB family tyrosine-protein kinase [Lactiplantibacillus plajomi]|uniref:Non-specific protein-tyrosine kinase n=1 Tax=Lactiplantibacillus plajomi TaxID=1457217 RepID=A0ABV6K658_9LACO|nr:CpsD/CapB family tyrosine-protein kinase [Lactiplantibacillus plajomi]
MDEIKNVIRQINTNLQRLNQDAKSIMFASVDDTAAQQTLLVNMGLMYGRAGESVLIVDTDFSNTRIASAFKLEPKSGLAEYIADTSITEAQMCSKLSTTMPVEVIVSGNTGNESQSSLLNDPRFDSLLNSAKNRFDHILINTASLPKIESLENLSRNVDGCILVVKPDVTEKKKVFRAYQQFRQAGTPVLGYVNINRTL